jgi:hypothetical protein
MLRTVFLTLCRCNDITDGELSIALHAKYMNMAVTSIITFTT